MRGDLQGGLAYTSPGHPSAAIWSGTAQSITYLNPPGYDYSGVNGMWGDEQVGGAGRMTPQGIEGGAGLWHGTPESFVLLGPSGATDAVANATDGVHQYGYAAYGSGGAGRHATMWSGSAASAVDLNPAGALESEIRAAIPGRQVGWSSLNTRHAIVWSGSALSAIDINPPGFGGSDAYGVCDSAIVGMVKPGGFDQFPAIWWGPNFTFEQLPIPTGYAYAIATSVEFYNGQYYIGGVAGLTPLGTSEAFLWIGVPAPASVMPFAATAFLAFRRRRAAAPLKLDRHELPSRMRSRPSGNG